MRKRVKRLHSDDARMLREMFYDLMGRIYELENAVGKLQEREAVGGDTTEIVEVSK